MKQRKTKDYLPIFLKGMAMGAADVVPGVSGGTIAFISGIYQELIESISGINLSLVNTLKTEGFSAFWKKANANFLIALVSGILISVFSVMKLMHYLLEHHPIQLWAFFFGLVLASTIYISKQITKWNIKNISIAIISTFAAFGLTQLELYRGSDSLFFLALSGAIASCALILPGISGAFILVLLGVYGTISEAVHIRDLKKIAAVGVGAIIGILSFSHLLKWLFKNYKNTTLAILTGFILGSLNKIWPWKKTLKSTTINEKLIILKETSISPLQFNGESHVISAVIFAIIGFSIILLLEKFAQKNTN